MVLALLWLTPSLAVSPQSAGTPPRPGQGILDVVVVDEEAKPLEGVLVSVPGYHSKTGLSGTCRFGLMPGRYAILVHKEGYRGRRVNAGVRLGETTTTQIKLRKLPPAHPPKK
jgi:uncharacterized membrane protein